MPGNFVYTLLLTGSGGYGLQRQICLRQNSKC